MIKRKWWLGIFLLLMFSLISCGKGENMEKGEFQIYYLNREEQRIVADSYVPEYKGDEVRHLAEELLSRMAIQPEKVGFHAVINNFSLKDCIVREGQITLNFTKEYEMQSPTREVLTRAAIVKTLTQLEGIQLILIQVEGKSLIDNKGEEVGVMSAEAFIDNTGQDINKYEETSINLYFANASGDKLVKVNRTLHYNTNISLERLVVDQIVAGPLQTNNNGGDIYPTLNKFTKVISVSAKDGICYVNLDSMFLTTINNVTPQVAIYSLVNSLTELPGIIKVQVSIEGETEINFREKYQLTTLFERNLEVIE